MQLNEDFILIRFLTTFSIVIGLHGILWVRACLCETETENVSNEMNFSQRKCMREYIMCWVDAFIIHARWMQARGGFKWDRLNMNVNVFLPMPCNGYHLMQFS